MSQPIQFILIFGNPSDGFTYVGPFSSRDDATQYADESPSDWWVLMLDAPATGA